MTRSCGSLIEEVTAWIENEGRLLRHSSRCDVCAQALDEIEELDAVLTELGSDLFSAVASESEPRPRPRSRWLLRCAAILTLAVAVSATGSWDSTQSDGAGTRWRGGSGRVAEMSAHRIESGAIIFAWEPIANADSYEVEVWTLVGDPVARISVNEPIASILTDQPLPFLWTVVATRGGNEIARSSLARVPASLE